MNPRPKRPIDRRLLAALAEHPVMASLVGAEMADRFTTTSTPLGILASVPLGERPPGRGAGAGPPAAPRARPDRGDGPA
ncbi:hypothetical protein ACWDWV_16740, partial [Streptosporangium sandarakinum]